MSFNRRDVHRSLIAGAVAATLAAASQFALAQAAPQPRASEEGGMRSGKIFTISNSASGNEVLVVGAGTTGALALLARYPTQGLGSGAGLGSQGAVTLSGDGRTLYVVNAGSNSISTFAVRRAGLVLQSVHDAGGLHPISVSEHDGLVYVLNDGGSGNVAGFRNQNGDLQAVPGSVQPLSAAGGTGPAQVAIGPDGDVLVVTEKNTNLLLSYALAGDGSAGAPQITASAGTTPYGFAFDRRNHLLVTEATASTLSSYRFGAAAPATPRVVSASVPTNQGAACWAVTTPNGHFVYTGNASTSSISQFAIDRRGAVALVAAAAADTAGGGAGDLAIASHGRTLSILAPHTPAIFSYGVGADGGLTPAGSFSGLPAGVVGLAAN